MSGDGNECGRCCRRLDWSAAHLCGQCADELDRDPTNPWWGSFPNHPDWKLRLLATDVADTTRELGRDIAATARDLVSDIRAPFEDAAALRRERRRG